MSKPRIIHYAWVVALCGTSVLFSALGLGRWAFGILLPGMQAGLRLSYQQVSIGSTSNYIGYLGAVLLVPLLLRSVTPRTATTVGLLLLGGGLLAVSGCQTYVALIFSLVLIGIGSGLANVPMMALIARWFCSDQRGRANGLVIAGNGSGMIFAGFAIPHLHSIFGAQGWRAGWITLGAIVLTVGILAGAFLHNHPSDVNLQPIGRVSVLSASGALEDLRAGHKALLALSFLYFVFGATSAVYGTFIVSTMIREYGFTESAAGTYWSMVGLLSIFSGLGFGFLSDVIGRRRALVATYVAQGVAYLLTGLRLGTGALTISVVLFGISLFATPTLITAAIADYFEVGSVASKLTIVTVAAAVGQVLGPVAAGIIAGSEGLFSNSYYAAGLMSLAAIIVVSMLPELSKGQKQGLASRALPL